MHKFLSVKWCTLVIAKLVVAGDSGARYSCTDMHMHSEPWATKGSRSC